jgi:hypothetical protein
MDLSWLWGGNGQTFEPGQFGASRPFPSKEDLEFARKNDAFRYEGEYTPNTFEVANKDVEGPTDLIRLASLTGLLEGPSDPDLLDTLARNKLAARRSGIVSLAANDSTDQVVGAKDFTYDGFAGKTYIDPKRKDPMWSFFGKEQGDQSTPTHEAAHRGLYKIIDEIEKMPNSEQTSELRNYLSDPNNNELAVRALMHDLYDDVEKERRPEQFNQFLSGDNPYQLDKAREMNSLAETIAQKMVQRRKPGGPW